MRCAAYRQRIIRGKKKPHPEEWGKPEENEVFHVFLICVNLRNLQMKSALSKNGSADFADLRRLRAFHRQT